MSFDFVDTTEQELDGFNADPLSILMSREGSYTEQDEAEMHAAYFAKTEQVVLSYSIQHPERIERETDYQS